MPGKSYFVIGENNTKKFVGIDINGKCYNLKMLADYAEKRDYNSLPYFVFSELYDGIRNSVYSEEEMLNVMRITNVLKYVIERAAYARLGIKPKNSFTVICNKCKEEILVTRENVFEFINSLDWGTRGESLNPTDLSIEVFSVCDMDNKAMVCKCGNKIENEED